MMLRLSSRTKRGLLDIRVEGTGPSIGMMNKPRRRFRRFPRISQNPSTRMLSEDLTPIGPITPISETPSTDTVTFARPSFLREGFCEIGVICDHLRQVFFNIPVGGIEGRRPRVGIQLAATAAIAAGLGPAVDKSSGVYPRLPNVSRSSLIQ